jgi:hypothetical protein
LDVLGRNGRYPRSAAVTVRPARWRPHAPHGTPAAGYPRVERRINQAQEAIMGTQTETGQSTGTKDKTCNIIWFTEKCLRARLDS